MTSPLASTNALLSYASEKGAERSYRGEKLDVGDFGYIKLERGLGVTTLGFTSDLSFAKFAKQLQLSEKLNSETEAHLVARLDVENNMGVELEGTAARTAAVEAGDKLLYALFYCRDYDLLWRKLSARRQGLGHTAEVAFVYEGDDAHPDITLADRLGSSAVQVGVETFKAQSSLL